MNISQEAIQVQLVSAWWAQIIPLAAILISLFSVGLTLYFRYSDRLHLVLDISQSIHLGDAYGAGSTDRINVRVTNKSPKLNTQITHLTLELSDGNTFTNLDGWHRDDTLPKVLGPGESASASYPAAGLGAALHRMGTNPKWMRAMAVSGHKTVRGKKSGKMLTKLRTYA